MRSLIATAMIFILLPLSAVAQQGSTYKWVDENGQVHYGDSIPAKYADLPKDVVNDHGVTVGNLEGKKTEEQLAAEKMAEEKRVAIELQKRADQALLATYLSVEEILMHRDRRVELFQAQSRVTELYLNNLNRRLQSLETEASRFKPYSEDEDAPMISDDLAKDLRETKNTIARHEQNLKKYRSDEQLIISRFAGDVNRFKKLKGID